MIRVGLALRREQFNGFAELTLIVTSVVCPLRIILGLAVTVIDGGVGGGGSALQIVPSQVEPEEQEAVALLEASSVALLKKVKVWVP